MDNEHIKSIIYYAPFVVAAYIFAIELFRGYYSRHRMGRNDQIINFVGLIQDRIIVQPAIAFISASLFTNLLPQYAGALRDVNFWLALVVFMVSQDLIHYWFHRLAHETPWLWEFHRTHHSAEEMSIMVAPRLVIWWQLILPVSYYAGLAIYLGLTDVFLVAYSIKQVISLSHHSDLRWDLPLYQNKWTAPFMWLVERIFTTPDAHHAHHGNGANGNPMGNYAPVIFLWDFIFGTAKLPHQRQDSIGINNDPHHHWFYQLYWPFKVNKDARLNRYVEQEGVLPDDPTIEN